MTCRQKSLGQVSAWMNISVIRNCRVPSHISRRFFSRLSLNPWDHHLPAPANHHPLAASPGSMEAFNFPIIGRGLGQMIDDVPGADPVPIVLTTTASNSYPVGAPASGRGSWTQGRAVFRGGNPWCALSPPSRCIPAVNPDPIPNPHYQPQTWIFTHAAQVASMEASAVHYYLFRPGSALD